MAERLKIQGTAEIAPTTSGSQRFRLPWGLDETLDLTNRTAKEIKLTADADTPVDLDSMAATGINFLYWKTTDPAVQVEARTTTALGATQISAGETFFIIARAEPITALSLKRKAGVTTTVEVIMGQI